MYLCVTCSFFILYDAKVDALQVYSVMVIW